MSPFHPLSKSVETYVYYVPPELNGERLDKALAQLCPEASRTLIRRVIDIGAVRVDGKRVRVASRPVRTATRIDMTIQKAIVDHPPHHPLDIIYAGEGLIVINKPPGQHVQGTAAGDAGTVARAVQDWLAAGGFPGRRAQVGLVHRLDAAASGLVVVGTQKEVTAALSEQFRERTVKREYLALVRGIPDVSCGSITLPLRKISGGHMEIADSPPWMEAHTDWAIDAVYGKIGLSLLRVRLQTGRMHQIRVHVARAIGPVVGDNRYGTDKKGTLALHAERLTLTLPDTGQIRTFVTPPPIEFFDSTLLPIVRTDGSSC